MQILSKTVVFVLLSAVLVAPVVVQARLASASVPERPAGCHEDGGKQPAPGPTSHQCCQGGHDFAVLLSAPGVSLEVSALIQFSQGAMELAALNTLPNPAIVSGDPPSPLRV
jgi:hypothetical protein